MPKISLIVPVYNMREWLPACLQSIAAQTFTDYELILVDDGSTDESPAICDEWAAAHAGCRVIHQQNRGLSGARNAGLDIACGEYIAFLDSDDLICPDYLRALLQEAEDKQADITICAVEDVAENGASQSPPYYTLPCREGVFSGASLLAELFGENAPYYTVAWNKLYRAPLWNELRYPEGRLHEDDAVAHYLLCAAARVACLAQPLYHYRLRSGSICRSGIKPGAFDAVLALADRYTYLEGRGDIPSDTRRRTLASCWKRYLWLCAQMAQAPSPALLERLRAVQPLMRGMLPQLATCRDLTAREKLSAVRWAAQTPETLCRIRAGEKT